MRRATAVLAAGVAAAGLAGDAHGMPAVRTAHVQAGATEFRFTLSRLRVRSGTVSIQLVNYGQDDHDLRLRRVGATRVRKIPRTHPGATNELTARLRAGTFRIWCSLPGHRAAGMHATLRVVRG